MAEKIPILQIEISDRAGSLQKVLAGMAEAGVDLTCLGAFSKGGGKGVAFLSAKVPRAALKYVKANKLKCKELAGFVLTGKDQCGEAAAALAPIAEKKIKGVFCLAAPTTVRNCQIIFAVDKKDSAKVIRALKG